MPGGGGTYRLPQIVGTGNAKYMILTGSQVDSAEALSMGLVSKVVAKASLMSEAMAVAEAVSQNSPNSIMEAKKAVYMAVRPDYSAERESFIASLSHPDGKEGTKAFLERRKPKFENVV
jgi:enoyl-CoA hydratase/carnithine racemase